MLVRAALAFCLFLVLVSGLSSAEVVDRIVAIIGREVVTLSEAEQARTIARMRTGADHSLAEVVERLIETRLVEREVERFSADPVPMELVDDALREVRAQYESQAAFEEVMTKSGLREVDLRAQFRRQLAVARYLEERFRALTYVTDDEVERYFLEDEELSASAALEDVSEAIRRLLEEKKFNQRVDEWIAGLKERSRIRRYVW